MQKHSRDSPRRRRRRRENNNNDDADYICAMVTIDDNTLAQMHKSALIHTNLHIKAIILSSCVCVVLVCCNNNNIKGGNNTVCRFVCLDSSGICSNASPIHVK